MQGPIKRRPARPAVAKGAKGKAVGIAAPAKPARAKAARAKAAKRPAEALIVAPVAAPPAPAGKPAEKSAPVKDQTKEKKPSKNRTEPLNFRVSAEFRRAFKRAAAAQDCKKVELLERIFTEWTARNPGSDAAGQA